MSTPYAQDDYDTAFHLGWLAAFEGKSTLHNPYDPTLLPMQHVAWNEGFALYHEEK